MNSTIYIRKENEAKWRAIKDKSQWVNLTLAQETLEEAPAKSPLQEAVNQVANLQMDAVRAGVPLPPNLERACCLGRTPCVHWQFNQDKQVYINSLSGREREIE